MGSMLLIFLIGWVTAFKDTQSDLVDMLSDVHHGRASTKLLPPSHLAVQLKRLEALIPSTTQVPTKPDHWIQVYKLLTTKAGIVGGQAIFEVCLPLILKEEFRLFNIIPVPTRHNNQFIFIQPEFRHILMNDHRTWYYPIQEVALKSCAAWEEGTMICTLQGPIHSMLSPETHCEVALLAHTQTLPEQCEVKAVLPTIYFQQLPNNQWVTVLPDKTMFDLQCQQQIQPVVLQGSGILTLNPGCTLRGRSVMITSHSSYVTTRHAAFIPMFNLSNEVQVQTKEMSSSSNDINGELSALQQKISDLTREEPWSGLNLHHVGHYATSSISIMIVLVLVVVVCKYLPLWKKKARDQSQPRRVERSRTNLGRLI